MPPSAWSKSGGSTGAVAVIERLTPEAAMSPSRGVGWLAITPADWCDGSLEEDTTEFIPWLNRVTKWARRRFARRMP